ncbi:DUF503 domain-containing protein [Ureibacillus sp. FSL K6-8385]|uniref:DUF503 domain-containing protein n=1 Tax=Ureibacillus terrenus TaxID=118246 RepID=A0A540V4I8_9BACL|nr:DUF503 domain-containing protein [Ureibacillus terrenus]MED3660442.1 DUF503 domain-containing protein [Ureibacillus terrenus]MED3762597.1 DUF503 domain-containing protein [Ureibacillus terrenus]TQE91660.1 DUF503 domain-containing protein [Ureibacillus terrenus]
MIVYLEAEFVIPDAHSLKEKRAVLQRMISRTRQRFNVSVAEIDHQDVWQRTKIAVVTVASSRSAADREIDHVIEFLESNPTWELLELSREYL